MFDMKITVVEVSSLTPHEEVIPEHLERLKREFSRSTYQRNPVIADEATGVILDGTHRWAAMRDLGYEWIATCLVDYQSPLVTLDSWARYYGPAKLSVSVLLPELEVKEVKWSEVRDADLLVVLERPLRVLYGSLEDLLRRLRAIDGRLSSLLGRPTYIGRSRALRSKPEGVLVTLPKLSKDDVTAAAKRGQLLLPKSTRHVIPARPMGVDVPLPLLRRPNLDLELVEEYVKHSEPLILKPPVILDREYQEELLYFV